jgi:hypothetical protein
MTTMYLQSWFRTAVYVGAIGLFVLGITGVAVSSEIDGDYRPIYSTEFGCRPIKDPAKVYL